MEAVRKSAARGSMATVKGKARATTAANPEPARPHPPASPRYRCHYRAGSPLITFQCASMRHDRGALFTRRHRVATRGSPPRDDRSQAAVARPYRLRVSGAAGCDARSSRARIFLGPDRPRSWPRWFDRAAVDATASSRWWRHMSAKIITLHTKQAVESAWEDYCALARALRDDNSLLVNREYCEKFAISWDRWRTLFLESIAS